MITKIDLQKYNYLFSQSSITELKSKTYIYGKNGSGKSTIVRALQEEYGDSYDLRVFQGFSKIISNKDELDALVLGVKNTDIQEQIKKIDEEIGKKQLLISSDPNNLGPLYAKKQQDQAILAKNEKNVKDAHTDYARTISQSLNLGRNYRRNNFEKDISVAEPLSDEEKDQYKLVLMSKKIDPLKFHQLKDVNFRGFLKATNEILVDKVTPKSIIEELTNNPEKQKFAQEGLHLHHVGEKCAFCGQTITESRWKRLEDYFSDEVADLENRIQNALKKISQVASNITAISNLDTDSVYPPYLDIASNINSSIGEEKETELSFLLKLSTSLRDKQNNIFSQMPPISLNFPAGFKITNDSISKLVKDNATFDENIANKQREARAYLRLDLVFNHINAPSYQQLVVAEKAQAAVYKNSQRAYSNEYNLVSSLNKKRNDLISQLVDERTAATNINKLLQGLGDCSFSLKYLPDKQRGLYQIIDSNGNPRSINTLSTGEKNIVAFLYFMNSLNAVKISRKEQIVILDDPMTSNDDMTQYLMIGVISEFFESQNHPQLILLTHNTHFYLQVRASDVKYKKVACFHLQKNGLTLVKHIQRSNEDIKTMYFELWDELHFAYTSQKPILMWNTMRRILETYNRFMFNNSSPREIEKKIENSSERAKFLSLLKGLNVNSHSGLESEMDISTLTVENLKELFLNLFKTLDAESHFQTYWQQDN